MAAHLNTNDRCQQAMITGPTSPPNALPNTAIQFSYKGTAGERLIIQQGGVPIASTLASGTQQVGKACLLESNKGMTQSTSFGIFLNGSTGCGAYVKDFVIDDLAFVSDATCPATSLVPDPGFERVDPAGMWSPSISNNGVAAGVAFSGVSAVASEARSGSHSFKLVNNVGCGNAQVSFPITVGASGAAAGPALQFYYRAPALTSSSLTVTGNSGTALTVATVATTYAPQVLCLDPTTTGQTISVTMNLTNLSSIGCSVTYTAETVWIDDLSVTTDPSCPID